MSIEQIRADIEQKTVGDRLLVVGDQWSSSCPSIPVSRGRCLNTVLPLVIYVTLLSRIWSGRLKGWKDSLKKGPAVKNCWSFFESPTAVCSFLDSAVRQHGLGDFFKTGDVGADDEIVGVAVGGGCGIDGGENIVHDGLQAVVYFCK